MDIEIDVDDVTDAIKTSLVIRDSDGTVIYSDTGLSPEKQSYTRDHLRECVNNSTVRLIITPCKVCLCKERKSKFDLRSVTSYRISWKVIQLQVVRRPKLNYYGVALNSSIKIREF